ELEAVFKGVGGVNFLSPVKEITKPVAKFIEVQLLSMTSDKSVIGWIILALALLLLFLALRSMVEVLKSLVIEKAKAWFDNYLFKNALRAFAVGILLTVLVQSSSITTSLIVPMAGAGILTLKQIFPYTLGANIGTTITAMLAALVTGSDAAITVAFSHLLFNVAGTAIFMPLKKIPITMAEKFAEYSIKSKLIPVGYIVVVFFVIPLIFIFLFR
ncbi:MAG: Na/Pi cotransporter family protein, partial [Ignavibacteriae bacterium]|nr:Na/Pi cotransporter family protein [Ignavibacteriota bacterium]